MHSCHPTVATRSISASPGGSWPKSFPFPEAPCTLFLFCFFAALPSELSPVSPTFLLRVRGKSLCSASLPVYSGRASGTGLSEGSHQLARRLPSTLFNVNWLPHSCLPCVASLVGATWQAELLWAQSNRKSMRNDFLYFAPVKEKGVKQGTKGCFKTFFQWEREQLENGGLGV